MCWSVAAPGGWCRMIWCPGRRPTAGLRPGARTAPGIGSTTPCATRSAPATDATRSPRPGGGAWDRVHDPLRDQVRAGDGRDPQPSAAVLDSQSAKSSEGGEAIGYDAGKRVRGRKRHLLVDTNGMILKCLVHSASVQDRAGAKLVLTGLHEHFPLVGLVWVDGGYVNSVDQGLIGWAAEHVGIEIVAVPRNADVTGFQVLPRRWVVERTFGWLSRCRRLARDYERTTAHAEAMIKVAMIRLMAARLAGEDVEPHGPIEAEAARRLADDDLNQD